MTTWNVTTTATALAGFPDTGGGAGPFIFSIGAFNDDGTPKYQTSTDFGETNGDVPTSEKDMAWTNYGTGNVNSSEVSDIISGRRGRRPRRWTTASTSASRTTATTRRSTAT